MSDAMKLEWKSKPVGERNEAVLKYFKPKAVYYDETDGQDYWTFSDRLLWELLEETVLQPIHKSKKNFTVFDAGCGTARWSSRILNAYSEASAILGDITPEMLAVSKNKIDALKLSDRAELHELDLNKLDSYNLPKSDIVICFHNVLSFVSDPQLVLESLWGHVAAGGYMVLVIPNLYHAASFNALQGKLSEAEKACNDFSVKFTDTVPDMWVFTPSKISQIFDKLGATQNNIMGFPVTVYPQIEETEIRGNSSQAKRIFSNPENFERLLKIELQLSKQAEAASRGNNLLCIAKKAT